VGMAGCALVIECYTATIFLVHAPSSHAFLAGAEGQRWLCAASMSCSACPRGVVRSLHTVCGSTPARPLVLCACYTACRQPALPPAASPQSHVTHRSPPLHATLLSVLLCLVLLSRLFPSELPDNPLLTFSLPPTPPCIPYTPRPTGLPAVGHLWLPAGPDPAHGRGAGPGSGCRRV
jgi:hypothetical protein